MHKALITNDAVVLGILSAILAAVFVSAKSERPVFRKLYGIVPPIFLCYFLPGLLGSPLIGNYSVISGDTSNLYYVSSRYLLPACLVLLCLSVDLKGVFNLGPKALIMFFTGTFGILIGGPITILILKTFAPSIVAGEGYDAVWRGMATIAGSWIGGGANQTAMKEIFQASDMIFSALLPIDILFGYAWLAVLLYLANQSDRIDAMLKADNSAIDELKASLASYHEQIQKIPEFIDIVKLTAVGFGFTGLAHLCSDLLVPFLKNTAPNWISTISGVNATTISNWLTWLNLTSSFFWMIVVATFCGVLLSFTKLRELEGVGASQVGTVFLYILIASIGMKMDVTQVFRNPGVLLIGLIWISIHAILLFFVAWLIRAPLFFIAVGSQANVGGAASAPVVASAFHPTLAPVGVLLAVLGYVVGTFAAWLCGLLMEIAAVS